MAQRREHRLFYRFLCVARDITQHRSNSDRLRRRMKRVAASVTLLTNRVSDFVRSLCNVRRAKRTADNQVQGTRYLTLWRIA